MKMNETREQRRSEPRKPSRPRYRRTAMNAKRAKWALAAVTTFAIETGLDIKADGMQTAIGDLLADLQHLCQQRQVDWDTVLASGNLHFAAEFNGREW